MYVNFVELKEGDGFEYDGVKYVKVKAQPIRSGKLKGLTYNAKAKRRGQGTALIMLNELVSKDGAEN